VWPFGGRPKIDPALGDAVAARLRVELAARNWRAASELFAAIDHPDDRAFYYLQAGQVDGVQDWISEWVAAEPHSNVPVLVAAQRYIAWAWEARSALLAEHVGPEQFHLFSQRLRVAEDLLRMAEDLDNDDPAPWAFLVTTARGLQLGQDEARRRFGEAVVRYRWHQVAHLQLLQQLCPKWGGSLEAVHDLAQRTISHMPDGCGLGVLAAHAHMEHRMQLDTDGSDYLRQSTVVADLNAAADRSVRHPEYRRQPGWPLIHNMFAWTFSRAGDWRAAAEQFNVIGDLATEWPWEYGKDALTGFASARRAARRHVAQRNAVPSAP
jgi:hypothetical protein